MESTEPETIPSSPPDAPRRKQKNAGRLWLILAAIVVIPTIAFFWYLHDADIMPTITIPPVPPLPSPNAEDTFVAAYDMLLFGTGLADQAAEGGYMKSEPPLADCDALIAKNPAALQKMREGFTQAYGATERHTADRKYPRLAKERSLATYLRFVVKTRVRQSEWPKAMDALLDGCELGASVSGRNPLMTYDANIEIQQGMLYQARNIIDHLNSSDAGSAARRLERIDSTLPTLLSLSFAEEKREIQEPLLAAYKQPRRQMTEAIFAINNPKVPQRFIDNN
jgi:hypothetical protein